MRRWTITLQSAGGTRISFVVTESGQSRAVARAVEYAHAERPDCDGWLPTHIDAHG